MSLLGEVDGVATVPAADVDDRLVRLDVLRHPGREPTGGGGQAFAARPVEHAPVPHVLAVVAQPAVEASLGGSRRVVGEGRVGHPPRRPVRHLEELLRPGGGHQPTSLQRHLADRKQRRRVERAGDRRHQVEGVVDVEGREHVDTDPPAATGVGPDLEVARRHPGDLPAEGRHRVVGPLVLPDHVERVGVRAQVRHVGVGVVADHVTVPHGAEQAAEGEERLETAFLAQVVQHPLQRVDDLLGHRPVGVRERPLEPAALVDRDGVAFRRDQADGIGSRAEADPLVEEGLAGHVLDQAHLGHPVQIGLEGSGPADPAVAQPGALALGIERPDPLAAEPYVDDLTEVVRDADPLAADREAGLRLRAQLRLPSSAAGNRATSRATCGSSDL